MFGNWRQHDFVLKCNKINLFCKWKIISIIFFKWKKTSNSWYMKMASIFYWVKLELSLAQLSPILFFFYVVFAMWNATLYSSIMQKYFVFFSWRNTVYLTPAWPKFWYSILLNFKMSGPETGTTEKFHVTYDQTLYGIWGKGLLRGCLYVNLWDLNTA